MYSVSLYYIFQMSKYALTTGQEMGGKTSVGVSWEMKVQNKESKLRLLSHNAPAGIRVAFRCSNILENALIL